MRKSMSTPLRFASPSVDGPPKRSLLDNRPLPVPFGAGGGVGRAALGVRAPDEDKDDALTSAGGFGPSQARSMSMLPSPLGMSTLLAVILTIVGGDVDVGDCGGGWAKARGRDLGCDGEIDCFGTKSCCVDVWSGRDKFETGAVVDGIGPSRRSRREWPTELGLTCGGGGGTGVVLVGCDFAASRVIERTGSYPRMGS